MFATLLTQDVLFRRRFNVVLNVMHVKTTQCAYWEGFKSAEKLCQYNLVRNHQRDYLFIAISHTVDKNILSKWVMSLYLCTYWFLYLCTYCVSTIFDCAVNPLYVWNKTINRESFSKFRAKINLFLIFCLLIICSIFDFLFLSLKYQTFVWWQTLRWLEIVF